MKNFNDMSIEELINEAQHQIGISESLPPALMSKSMINSANKIAGLGKVMISVSTIIKDAIEGLSAKMDEMITSNSKYSKVMTWLTAAIAFSALVQIYLAWQ